MSGCFTSSSSGGTVRFDSTCPASVACESVVFRIIQSRQCDLKQVDLPSCVGSTSSFSLPDGFWESDGGETALRVLGVMASKEDCQFFIDDRRICTSLFAHLVGSGGELGQQLDTHRRRVGSGL